MTNPVPPEVEALIQETARQQHGKAVEREVVDEAVEFLRYFAARVLAWQEGQQADKLETLQADEQSHTQAKQVRDVILEVSEDRTAVLGVIREALFDARADQLARDRPYMQHLKGCASRKLRRFVSGFHLEEHDGELDTVDDTKQIDGPGECDCQLDAVLGKEPIR